MDRCQRREGIMAVMDELEYLFESLGEEQQDVCPDMMSLQEKPLTALD